MKWQRMAVRFFLTSAMVVVLSLTARIALSQQDWINSGINLGAPKIKLAVPDFPPKSVDQQLVSLTQEFNQVLWSDLDSAGIFDMVSKSNYPLKVPEEPLDVDFNAWSSAPASAQMLVFGKAESINANLVITGRVFDLGNQANPGVLAKRYVATLNEVSTRESAHRFADEIIKTLGGGLPGINESRIAFVRKGSRSSSEIWVMDYDGFNQHPITSYHSLSTTPRWSPDNSKLAFTSYASGNPEIYLFSFETNRRVSFPQYKGLNTTPAWSPDGSKIAFCSSMGGDPEIYISSTNGYNLQRLTFSPGVDVSPAWNPKTGNELAFVSDRSGSPQIYIMSADGTNLRRMTTLGGDASAPVLVPEWAVHGLSLARVRYRNLRHLHYGNCHRTDYPVDARCRPQRASHVVAGRPPPGI